MMVPESPCSISRVSHIPPEKTFCNIISVGTRDKLNFQIFQQGIPIRDLLKAKNGPHFISTSRVPLDF